MDSKDKFRIFGVPVSVLFFLLLFIYVYFSLHSPQIADLIAIAGIAIGSINLIVDIVKSLKKNLFALDYIALLAIITAVATSEYLVALVIVLMLSGGNALEIYGITKAKKTLTALINRIPNKALIYQSDKTFIDVDIEKINVGESIGVRRGEVIPLDGIIISGQGLIDESSLSGEPYEIEKSKGDKVYSGTINVGDIIIIQVTKNNNESAYTKIIKLVEKANAKKAPLVRLANRYSVIFTLTTLVLCIIAYVISNFDIDRVLAVLVVATPCPLILAAPIAIFGGMNKSAAKKVLIKNPAILEKLNTVTDVVFDKTGTITIGKPSIEKLEIMDSSYSEESIYSIAESIERNSLHPFAKTIISKAQSVNAPRKISTDIHEKLGVGVFGTVDGKTYSLTKSKEDKHSISLLEGSKIIAHFMFEDKIKEDFSSTISKLRILKLALHIFTGDKEENTKNVRAMINSSGSIISITSEMKPEDKQLGVEKLKAEKKVVAMIGDGINDAPALAAADIGMVFSNEEQTASSEAADIVMLHGNLDTVISSIDIAHHTIDIALQSIIIGIGLSIVAMVLASVGIIKPITGAILQEGIDILVIFNALRASL